MGCKAVKAEVLRLLPLINEKYLNLRSICLNNCSLKLKEI